MANTKIYYGIKFPFTDNNENGHFIDLNETYTDKIVSDILHVLLTPVKTRIHKPDFGTNLSKYIFDNNDDMSWNDIKSEAVSSVNRYVTNVSLSDIQIYKDENNEHNVYLYLKYSVKKGNTIENNELGVKIV